MPAKPSLNPKVALWPVLLIIALCLIIFSRGFSADFVMDDWPVIHDNSKITQLKYIPDYFTSGVWANTDLADEIGLSGTSLYRPIFLLSLNIGYQLWGNNPEGYHALNIFLHSINSLLIFFLITRLLPAGSPKTTIAATLGAALFATHPIHVESIAWIAGLTDPLVTLFILAGMLSYHQFSRTQNMLPALAALLFYVLALLSKEMAILFPLLLIAHDQCFEKKFYLKRYLPYGLILILYFIVRNIVLEQSSADGKYDISQWPVLLEFISHYIQLLFFPWPLEFYYLRPTNNIPGLILGGSIIISALIYLPRAHKPTLFIFSLVWIIVTLAPVLPLALIKDPVFATRALYLPSVALAFFTAWLYTAFNVSSYIAALLTVIIAIFIPVSIHELDDWKNDVTFYQQAIKASPKSFKPYDGLADAYERNNDYQQSIIYSLQSAALAQTKNDRLNLIERAARLYGQNGDIKNSEHYYQEIIKLDPQRSSAWVGLGNNALARKSLQQAKDYYLQAYQMNPANKVASYNLTLIYQRLGDRKSARHFQQIFQQSSH